MLTDYFVILDVKLVRIDTGIYIFILFLFLSFCNNLSIFLTNDRIDQEEEEKIRKKEGHNKSREKEACRLLSRFNELLSITKIFFVLSRKQKVDKK